VAGQSRAPAEAESNASVEIIAGRYRKLRELGGGGMAVVYEVVDSSNGRRVALKRPRSEGSPEHRKRIADLFAREFHTLTQLAHPRIVEVYDYRVDEHGPYYTMEILDGGDLQELTPVDYRRACSIASDVCSALSLLHSRRIIHRDVSPRNIRCTSDGLAKLIDFGAMTHMGPSKDLVGTPVYCAPEILNLQALDARTDLYALGASLYYALTGHHAYPVRDFASLPNAWRFGLARPSEVVSGIPEALDALVLDLLQLQPDDRPSNAAEVMARLSAIAGTRIDEQLLVAQAYLATPAFVGRDEELNRIKARTMRAMRKRGTAMLIEGAAGSGRTRLLEAILLDSKLLGMTVVRADVNDGEVDYGVVRRLLIQLQQVVPDALREAAEPMLAVLGHIAPELSVGRDLTLVAPSDLGALRPQLQNAVRQVLLGVSKATPLLLAIDDLHAIDEPSTAAIGLIAQQVQQESLVILATTIRDATPNAVSAFKLFSNAARRVQLPNLTQAEAQSLLTSVFGASHTLKALTQRLHALSGGSPRDLMRLAQHLVDSRRARYEAGTWSLQADLDATELPASVSQMLSSRLRQLAGPTVDLARALALCPEKSFSFEECQQLSEREEAGAVLADIEQLTQAEVLRALGDRAVLSDRAWVPLLCAGLSPERERALHLRLASVFETREAEVFRHAQHLLRAGEVERALDRFVGHAVASRALTDRNPEAFHQLLLALPEDWFESYEQVLQQLRERQRPKSDEFAIRMRVSGMASIAGVGPQHMNVLMLQLKDACGLTDWEQLDPALDPAARLQRAFGQAQARYTGSAERERFTDPVTAIRELATSIRGVMGFAAISLDLRAAQSVPSLRPLFVIAPALVLSEQLVQGVQARLAGRIDRAREIYRALLEGLAVPESTGLPPTYVEYTRLIVMNGLAVLDASCGLPCLDAADQIETHPTLQSNAWLVRMVHHLWQGNSHEAERCRKQFEVARVQNSASQTYESTHLPWQVIAFAAMDDLTRLKQSLDEVAPLAVQYPSFNVLLAYGQAEYQRIRGDSAGARVILAELLRSWDAGTHQIWAQLAAAHVRAIDAGGDAAAAVEQGRVYIAAAARAELGASMSRWISLALCVAEAKLKQAEAVQTADEIVERCLEGGASGLILGLAYEARARVAVLLDDAAGYDRHLALCEEEFAKAANSALSAKLQKLRRDAQRRKIASQAPMLDAAQRSVAASIVKSRLGACNDANSRAHAILNLLAQHSGATAGYLYLMRKDGLSWVASLGPSEPSDALHTMAREYVLAETQSGEQITGASQLSVVTQWTAFGETSYRPVLLSHYNEAGCVISGLAVFVVEHARPFVYPGEVATQISRMTHDVGDATGVVVQDD